MVIAPWRQSNRRRTARSRGRYATPGPNSSATSRRRIWSASNVTASMELARSLLGLESTSSCSRWRRGWDDGHSPTVRTLCTPMPMGPGAALGEVAARSTGSRSCRPSNSDIWAEAGDWIRGEAPFRLPRAIGKGEKSLFDSRAQAADLVHHALAEPGALQLQAVLARRLEKGEKPLFDSGTRAEQVRTLSELAQRSPPPG